VKTKEEPVQEYGHPCSGGGLMSEAESNSPAFSLILPTHNRPEILLEAVRSVFEQTLTEWELIVVDEASEPAVEPKLAKEFPDSRVRVIRREENEGGAAGKKIGAQAARGHYLAFLDDDDLLDPGYFQSAYDVLESHPEIRALFMGVKWFGEKAVDGQRAQDRNMDLILASASPDCDEENLCRFEPAALFRALMDRVPMPYQRPVVSREEYFRIGEYRPECFLWDCDWALRAVAHSACALLDKGLYLQRAQRQGYSSKADRFLEQVESNLEMKEYLLKDPDLESIYQQHLKDALSRDWISYAWQLQQRGRWGDSNQALKHALEYGFSVKLVRLYLIGVLRRGSEWFGLPRKAAP